uniref:MalT-like TPR region domain-containing protein n=1 Tax=Amphora coffeiformis TaxID=265554 RepID=A0A7S3LC17_9STRA|mmetsp:Transcript_12332/g.23576  ORF Transcript_12332/g.23576 Transcript_12332/m.23576 type:complete len:443 (+) Transcript_12332:223-1551(+)
MPPALRPPQLPPRSPRYPIKVEDLEAPASPPLPNDAVPKDGDDFVSGLSEDFVADDHLTSKHRQHSAEAQHKHLETPSLGTNGSANKLNLFWRGNSSKVASTDVASVGNASDTPIPQGAGTLTGRALHEHAKVALNREEYGTALQSFEALLEAQIQRFGPCHASVAAAMHNVGVCRQRMGQFALAENLLAEAVQIRRQTLGPDHVEVAASLSKLGSVRLQAGRHEEAFADLQKALKIAKKLEKNKTIAQMLCHLGCFYFQVQELFAAQATFQEALNLYRDFWQEESPSMKSADRNALMMQLTDTLCNIGTIQNRRKRFTSAISSFQEALDLQRGVLPHDHPRILSTLDNLAYAYSKNKEYARAVTCYKNMLKAQVSHSRTFTPDCLETIHKRLLMYEKLKLPNQAVEDLKEIILWQKTMLPRDGPIVLETKKLLEQKRSARR